MTKTKCARCGLEADAGDLTAGGVCALPHENMMACRDRELANLQTLLRSVLLKLEFARDDLEDGDAQGCRCALDVAIEALSRMPQ